MAVEVATIAQQRQSEDNLRPSRPSKLRNIKVLILISAYNESKLLPNLLTMLRGRDILLIDDGSTDDTRQIGKKFDVNMLIHDERMGQAASLDDGISYAVENNYDVVVKIDADAVPGTGSVDELIKALDRPQVGGASCRQVPIGPTSVAYFIDE